MQSSRVWTFLICVLVVGGVSVLSEAQIPQTMSYQGVLTDGAGGAVPDGTYDLAFKIYTGSSGGTEIWTETQTVPVTGGIFSVTLGSQTALAIAFDVPYWLGVSVDGGPELSPRRELTSAGYALNARGVADSAVTSEKIKLGHVVRSLNVLTDDVTIAAGNNVAITTSGDSIIVSSSGGGSSLDWSLTGNAGTSAGTNFLGTTDDQALEFHVNSARILRLEPHGTSPNILAGHADNAVAPGVWGAVISGAGSAATPNSVFDEYGVVGGGEGNTAGSDDGDISTGEYATVGGGSGNLASGPFATVAGGSGNDAGGDGAVVGGGDTNEASGFATTVSGGVDNIAAGGGAVIGGGAENLADGQLSVIGGGLANDAPGDVATIGGGEDNIADALYAAIGGGLNNVSGGDYAFIGGGETNVASGVWATVSGGQMNNAGGQNAAVGGGSGNSAALGFAVVGGGSDNQATAEAAFVGGGDENVASGNKASVVGGHLNTASGWYAAVGGGISNLATGLGAAVAGGGQNAAEGDFSFAAGYRAKINPIHHGAILLSDSVDFDFNSAAAREFAVRATGGVRLITGIDGTGTPNAGVTLAAGSGTWGTLSDRDAKENFQPVDSDNVLELVSELEITTWNYKAQESSTRHMGPMAQDFYAAFELGGDEKRITTVDADGVSLAAIQALNQKLNRALTRKDAQIAELEKRITRLESLVLRVSEAK